MTTTEILLFWLFYISFFGIFVLLLKKPIRSIFLFFQKRRLLQKKMKEVLEKQKEREKKVQDFFSAPDAKEKENLLQKEKERDEDTQKNHPSSKKIHPKVPTLLRKGETLVARKDFDEAKKVFLQVLAWDEDNADASAHLAYSYLQTGELKKAEVLFKKVLSFRKKDASLLTNYALCLLEQKDSSRMEESTNALREAIEIDSNNAERYSNLGQSLFFKGDISGAIPAFENAIRLDPRNVEYQFFLADTLLAAQRFSEAKEIFAKIVDMYPLNEAAKEEVRKLKEQGY